MIEPSQVDVESFPYVQADQMYRNDGGSFVDVSAAAGLKAVPRDIGRGEHEPARSSPVEGRLPARQVLQVRHRVGRPPPRSATQSLAPGPGRSLRTNPTAF